ncbi:MAG: hypothetical protein WKF73_15125 [Nocardioidaceae bacterium]
MRPLPFGGRDPSPGCFCQVSTSSDTRYAAREIDDHGLQRWFEERLATEVLVPPQALWVKAQVVLRRGGVLVVEERTH